MIVAVHWWEGTLALGPQLPFGTYQKFDERPSWGLLPGSLAELAVEQPGMANSALRLLSVVYRRTEET
jgi:hypothetical protein